MSSSQFEEMKERQRRWMKEREVDMERGKIDTTALSPAQLVNTLTVKIASRLENAIKPQEGMQEAACEMKDVNTCSICFEFMLPKERSPILLFPCGHTFCKMCLASNEKKTGSRVCPWCREKIHSQAVNIALQNMIVAFAKNKGLYRESESAPLPPAPAAPEASYDDQLSMVNLRCSILQEELAAAAAEQHEIDEKLFSQRDYFQILQREENIAMEKLRQVQKELDLIHDYMNKGENQVRELEAKKEESVVSVRLIRETLAPLLKERTKLETLARLNSGAR